MDLSRARSINVQSVTPPVRCYASYSQQLRLMRLGEKPLEHTHFIPALCFDCASEIEIYPLQPVARRGTALAFSLPRHLSSLRMSIFQTFSPKETRRTSVAFQIGKKNVYQSLQPIIRFFRHPVPTQPWLTLTRSLPYGSCTGLPKNVFKFSLCARQLLLIVGTCRPIRRQRHPSPSPHQRGFFSRKLITVFSPLVTAL